jgi:hypothetical protein
VHQHFHIAGRKGDAWTSLFTGWDSIAYAKALATAAKDESLDEIRPCAHIHPGKPIFPKQLAAAAKAAQANALARTAEEIAAEKEQLEENQRQGKRRALLHAQKVLWAHSPTGRGDDTVKNHQANMEAAAQALEDFDQAEAARLESIRRDAKAAELEAQIVQATEALKVLKAPISKKSR